MDPAVDPSDPKPLQRLLNDLRGRMRMLSGRDDAKGILLVVGFAAFFALAFYYAGDDGEQHTSVPACADSCGGPVASAAPESVRSESVRSETVRSDPAPVIGHLPSDDRHREPAPDADRDRQPSRDIEIYRRPAPDAEKHRPQSAPSAKGHTASIVTSPGIATLLGIVTSPGVVTSHKTGARARVGIAHAARFQAYIDDLERNHGARVLFMGGIRPGHCASYSLHPCGRALDVCQLSRGVVDARCHLPPRRTLAQIAAAHGLFEGGRWCNSDYGHAQLGVTAGDCGDRGTRIVQRQMAPRAARAAASVSYE
jgi:hypothetical protein